MAKISPVSIKYMITAKFEAEGTLEKPDVIGALFGQTEGLLGTDLEMRELQKEGKIGRIEVDLTSENSKTLGKIQIPSALDKTETTLIAASIETIERIGPSNAKIEIEKIEDVRANKRDFILERAKKLLEGIDACMPNTREMSETVKIESRTSKIKEYGDEKLPCGDISGKELIIVEGRADVVNLLRHNVDNVIGMNGTKLPKEVSDLSREKEVTLFVDGDRGGNLIARNVIENAKVDWVAIAPEGKEVEELQGKEILMSLRKKISVSEYLRSNRDRNGYERRDYREERRYEEREKAKFDTSLIEKNKDKLKEILAEIENTNSAVILDDKLDIAGSPSSRGIFSAIERIRSPCVLIVDSATPSIVRIAEKSGINTIIAKKFSASSEQVNLVSL